MVTKVLLFAAFVAVTSAGYLPYAAPVDYYAAPEPFNYGYDTVDEYGNQQWKQESSDVGGNVVGSYGYTDAYGISRKVNYVADATGFHADIQTNEPGTDNQNPADVNVVSSAVSPQYDYGYAKSPKYYY